MNLDTVKVGDRLFISNRYSCRLGTVARVLKLHVVDDKGTKWRLRDGYEVGGDSFTNATAEVYIPGEHDEKLLEQAHIKRADFLNTTNWRKMTPDQLARILAIVQEGKQ